MAAKQQDWLVAYTIRWGKASFYALPFGNLTPGSPEMEAARQEFIANLPFAAQGTEQFVRASSEAGALRGIKGQVEGSLRAARQFARLYRQRYNSPGTMTEIRPFADDLFIVLVSYTTPVAALIGDVLVRTSTRYSVTTSKHLSTWHPPGRAAGMHLLADEQFFRAAMEGIVKASLLEPEPQDASSFSREDVFLLMTAFPEKTGALVENPSLAMAEIKRARERVPHEMVQANERLWEMSRGSL